MPRRTRGCQTQWFAHRGTGLGGTITSNLARMSDAPDPFATGKPDARLIKLLIRAHRFNATLVGADGLPFAAVAKRAGVSASYFTRLIRLSYLAPDMLIQIFDVTVRETGGDTRA